MQINKEEHESNQMFPSNMGQVVFAGEECDSQAPDLQENITTLFCGNEEALV